QQFDDPQLHQADIGFQQLGGTPSMPRLGCVDGGHDAALTDGMDLLGHVSRAARWAGQEYLVTRGQILNSRCATQNAGWRVRPQWKDRSWRRPPGTLEVTPFEGCVRPALQLVAGVPSRIQRPQPAPRTRASDAAGRCSGPHCSCRISKSDGWKGCPTTPIRLPSDEG